MLLCRLGLRSAVLTVVFPRWDLHGQPALALVLAAGAVTASFMGVVPSAVVVVLDRAWKLLISQASVKSGCMGYGRQSLRQFHAGSAASVRSGEATFPLLCS